MKFNIIGALISDILGLSKKIESSSNGRNRSSMSNKIVDSVGMIIINAALFISALILAINYFKNMVGDGSSIDNNRHNNNRDEYRRRGKYINGTTR